MRYPSQRKCSSTYNFLVVEPISHILLEHWMVINALRNVGPRESKGLSLLLMYKALLESLTNSFSERRLQRVLLQYPARNCRHD